MATGPSSSQEGVWVDQPIKKAQLSLSLCVHERPPRLSLLQSS